MQNSENEKSDTEKDWIVYSKLRQRQEDLIINFLRDRFGRPYTRQIIETATSKSDQSLTEMFSDYENFVRTIKNVFGKQGQKEIFKSRGLKNLKSKS